LDNLVLKAWFADRPLLASLLIDPHPLYWRCLIAVASQSVVKITQVVFKVIGVLLWRKVVNVWLSAFLCEAVSLHHRVMFLQVFLEGPMGDTPGSPTISTKLQRIAKQAEDYPDLVFNNLYHLLDYDLLRLP